MASNHPIDQLFREGVGNMEMKPSSSAWDDIQKQTSKQNNKASFWRVAAAVTLLVTASLMTLTNTRQGTDPVLSDNYITVDAPSPLQMVALTLPEKEVIRVESTPKAKLNQQEWGELPLIETSDHQSESSLMAIESMPTWDLQGFSSAQIAIRQPIIPQIHFEGLENNKINIFYYTKATLEKEDASKRKLAKILDYAKTTNPVEWVGDIRNKKDEFIDNVFSLD
jgi:hypothetical protein